MGGMHLLPAYWTTNNHKRRKKKKVSAKMQASIDAHNKYLKSVGYDPNYKPKAVPLKLDRPAVKLPQKSITDYDWRIQTKKDAKVYNGNVVIGQAYNKGNLVVLSAKESKEVSTGKRR